MFGRAAMFGATNLRAAQLMAEGMLLKDAEEVASAERKEALLRAAKETAAMQETTQPPAIPGTLEKGEQAAVEQLPTAAPPEPKAKPTNQKTWDDARLRALWEESLLPGVTDKSLAAKHGVSRQRIGALIAKAKKRFSAGGTSSPARFSTGLVHRMGD